MTKKTQNHFQYALVEIQFGRATAWIENTEKWSLHLNDEVVIGEANLPRSKSKLWACRVIRRTNTLPDNLHKDLRITFTANQFPVSEAPVQPELPVVPINQMRLDRINDAESCIAEALIQIRKAKNV